MRQFEEDRNQLGGPAAHESYLTDGTTVMSWLNTRDHKRIGVMFLAAVVFFLFLGGVFAMSVRLKLLYPGPFLFDALTYNRLFTLHGVTMIFLYMIPAIPAAFGNFVLPLMLGARDVAFPRLNLASFYVYLTGAVLAIWAMIHGGAPVLFQHLFWFYSHPAVYIMVLPGMAVISECVATFSRKNPFGYKAIAYSSIGIAFVGFFTWGHHLFVAGQSAFDNGIFGVLSMFVGIFTAIKVFNWVGTMYRGAISFKTPFAYICGFLFFLVFGGMTGVALATVALDVHWHDTYFIVAHFHFIMVGAVIMAFLAGLHYWFPKMFGRTYHEGWGLVAASLIILGFNATFIPQFLLGNNGMPRRYYQYPEHFQALNVASTAGATLLGFGFIIIFIYLVIALRWGQRCERNPWGSKGFEWLTDSPPPTHNFDVIPTITQDPHDYRTHAPSGVYTDV